MNICTKEKFYRDNSYYYYTLALVLQQVTHSVLIIQEWITKDGICGRLYPRVCDLRHENDVLDTFRWVETFLGGVDVLVNNAGITGQNSIVGEEQYQLLMR
jgi:NAD(P)-dependent dehydrogenase (short-subunit alcohol dehydrogenase family)